MMRTLRIVWSEFIGLFVDDAAFAACIVAWIALTGLGLPRLAWPSPWPALVLFAGLAAILIESATRRARSSEAATTRDGPR